MINEWLTILRNMGSAIYGIFMLPGNIVVSGVATHAPAIASAMSIGSGDPPVLVPALLSLFIWLVFAVVVWELVRLYRNTVRIVGASLRTLYFRVTQSVAGIRIKFVFKLRQLFPHRGFRSTETLQEIEFDDLDLEVLDTAAALEPGLSMTVPDLAAHFNLRPDKVRRSLEKLQQNQMLDVDAASTDSDANYRMTHSGAAFRTMWQRQSKRS